MAESTGIHPSDERPWYWAYDGEPTMLLGATDTDNLFQWADGALSSQLERLESAGGNYVRNTMSDRGSNDVHAFAAVRDGIFDLERWNGTYWDRFETFLEETHRRDIVVQLTLWDQHDFSGNNWENNPWNPFNNVNYGRYESGIASGRDVFSGGARNRVVYPHLRCFVDRVLDISLEYDHVLYNVNNESWAGESWECHWANRIRDRADEVGTSAHVTNMNIWPGQSVATVIRNPDCFSYVEVSQVNQHSKGYAGEEHWDAVQSWQNEIADELGPRPLNNVKIYGTDEENPSAGSAQDAIERFWRQLIGGCASARFHRPTAWGIGLDDRSGAQLRSARMLEDAVDLFSIEPANNLLGSRRPNDAFCAATPGCSYVVYFPGDQSVTLDLSDSSDRFQLAWLYTGQSEWGHETDLEGGSTRKLLPPESRNTVAVIT
ncbi:hypothetical protein OB955_22495 [Halobacteria archaeon AArc-m2/3/4]|uniref:Uncharacterized protein n=1 Tax=Natronoglomus mannanivorans TaxID=2979990 RepID=A0ABT2QKK0_9EURY|nr:hypothetical protein [Halobacteria archaeon AArc-m2/3/4]